MRWAMNSDVTQYPCIYLEPDPFCLYVRADSCTYTHFAVDTLVHRELAQFMEVR